MTDTPIHDELHNEIFGDGQTPPRWRDRFKAWLLAEPVETTQARAEAVRRRAETDAEKITRPKGWMAPRSGGYTPGEFSDNPVSGEDLIPPSGGGGVAR